MKRIGILIIWTLSLYACKKDKTDPDTLMESLAGTWKLSAREVLQNGKSTWEPVTGTDNKLTFRSDGVILGPDGLPICCGPEFFYLNSVKFVIAPKDDVIPNPACAAVNCVQCESWGLYLKGDELDIRMCLESSLRGRYIKE